MTKDLNPQSKDWLVAALDPFHDAPLRVEGFPGLENRRSVTTVYKSTFTIEGGTQITPNYTPVTLGEDNVALQVDSNEVNIQFSPVVTADSSVYTLPVMPGQPPGLSRPFDLSKPQTNQWGPAPITVWWKNSSGSTGYRVFPKVPDTPFRIVAIGYEVRDVTPEMYRQGTIFTSSAPLTSIRHNVWLGSETLTAAGDLRLAPEAKAMAPSARLIPCVCAGQTQTSSTHYVYYLQATTWSPAWNDQIVWMDPLDMEEIGFSQMGGGMLLTHPDATGTPVPWQGNPTSVMSDINTAVAAGALGVGKCYMKLYDPATGTDVRGQAVVSYDNFALTGAPNPTLIPTAAVQAKWLASSRTATQSLLLQDTTEWELAKGAYIVPRMIDTPVWDSSASLDTLAPTAALTSGAQTGRDMLVSRDPAGKYWSLCAGSTSSWAECTANIVGAAFRNGEEVGLTRLTVTVRMFCEILPSPADTTLMTLARPAAPYDPHILSVYSRARNMMPLATAVKNNAIGGWLLLVVQAIRAAVTIARKIREAIRARRARTNPTNG